MFRNNVQKNSGEERQFSCPARPILTKASTIEMNSEPSPELESEGSAYKNIGIGLFHIYREAEKVMEQGSFSAQRTQRDLDTMIQDATSKER